MLRNGSSCSEGRKYSNEQTSTDADPRRGFLRIWVQGLAAEDEHHKRDKKRASGDAMNDGPAAKKHSNSPPSAETQEQEGTKQIAKEDEDEEVEDEDEDEEDTGDEDECSAISIYLP
jgi:hypothetical protein